MDFVIEENYDGAFESVCLQWKHRDAMLAEMKDRGLRTVVLNSAWGWKEGASINFIKKHDWIEGLEIIGEDCDITVINNLPHLKYLRLTSDHVTGSIDFRNLTALEYFCGMWKQGRYNHFDHCNRMRSVHINRLPYDDLTVFSAFHDLRMCQLNYPKMQSLKGLEACHQLNDINIYSASKLRSIELPVAVAGNITRLAIEKCRCIESYAIVEEMLDMDGLYIFESAPIHSVDFFRKMRQLRYAYVGVDILDENVSYLQERGFEFKNWKKYKK